MSYSLLIDGALVPGADQLDVVNPATERVFATAPRANADQLNASIDAAKRAFPTWSQLPVEERKAKLVTFADAIESRFSEFVRMLTTEQGKPTAAARFEMTGTIAILRHMAALGLPERVIREDPRERVILQRKPLGVVAAITSWNYPMISLMIKIASALITGNTVVGKPAPTTPLTALMLAEIAARIFPAGVLNVIVDNNDLGPLMTSHPDIAKVAFTGATETGRKVMQSASAKIMRLTLELGGNDAAIVLDDADVSEVAPKIFAAAMVNSGQACLAAKRVYAPGRLYDALCEAFVKLAKDAVVGDGDDPATQLGPIQNRVQFDKLKGYLADAHANGKVIAGGAPLDRAGYFIPPTIVRDIPDHCRLVREEQFGPIMPVLRYDDIDDAIRRANDTEFGQGGSIWTSDPERAVGIARKFDSGLVWINKHLVYHPDIPLGGAKQSGYGVELGLEGLEAFTQTKHIYVSR